jgi:SAM-dependent methyltransferase
LAASRTPIRTLLELGSGGGNNASHLKTSLDLTLVDISPSMLDLSRTINPECEHIVGDMRRVRLQREFDAVLVHDAVMHLTTNEDLRECIRTAFVHCKSGGVTLFMPDFIRETFQACVHHGGHDGDDRGLRYIEWTYDPDPTDATYTVDFVCMLREGREPVRVEHDCHVYGLFSRTAWLELLSESGFTAQALVDPYGRAVFIAAKDAELDLSV